MTFVMFMLAQMEAVDDMGIIGCTWKGNKETEELFKYVSWNLPAETKMYIVNAIHDF